MYSWKPSDAGMPGHTLPIIRAQGDEQKADDINPEAEGVPQRSAKQERNRRDNATAKIRSSAKKPKP